MKIAKLAFLIMMTAVLFIGGNARETGSKPLKLSLQVKENEQLCVGKPFTILARLENVSKTEQLPDERKLWRFSFSWETIESNDKNKSDNSSDLVSDLSKIKSGASVVKRENWNFIKLKPGDFYEDRIVLAPDEKYFDKAGSFIYQLDYWQLSDKQPDNVSSFVNISSTNSLKIALKDCK